MIIQEAQRGVDYFRVDHREGGLDRESDEFGVGVIRSSADSGRFRGRREKRADAV